jgi:hypothetical protein
MASASSGAIRVARDEDLNKKLLELLKDPFGTQVRRNTSSTSEYHS